MPFLLAAILALVSGAVLGIYSSGLTLLSLGVRIPRPAAAFVDGVILTLGTIWVVFFAEDFLGPFQSFLITLGVPLAAWAGIMIADIALRKRDYDEEALFDPAGRYGSVDVAALATMVGASVARLGPGRQQLRHRRHVEQLAGLPHRAARSRHLRRRPGRALLGGSVGLRQPRRAARARPRLRRDVRRPAREGPPPGVLSATRPDWPLSLLETHCTVRGNTQVRRRVGADVKIEIWSDVVCPWCYIGKRRIENALAEFEHADEVEVHWRSYQLDPGAPTEPTESTTTMLARKYGQSPDGAQQMQDRVEAVAAEEGLVYRLSQTLHLNTVDAHRLIHLAHEQGGNELQGRVKEALLAAYFTEAPQRRRPRRAA